MGFKRWCTSHPAVFLLTILSALVPGSTVLRAGGDCTKTSVGFIPLNDLGQGTYQGFEGGLYPLGTNARPAFHDFDADTFARIALLDPNGTPEAGSGKAVLLSVGMSNTNFEFTAFIPLANADPRRNQRVTIVNGAQGGWSADKVVDPNIDATFWSTIDSRLAAAGVTPLQVEAIWLKEADARPTLPFPMDEEKLQSELGEIARMIKTRYPNSRQIYLTSRIYAGYAVTTLNPEPFAYQSGFAVKKLIEGQLNGAPTLNFNPTKGSVVSPWVAWGPYLWADGLNARSDGLIWECADFQSDGTHPSASGDAKVANALLTFFQTDPIASRWYEDCDPNNPDVFSVPPRVLDLSVEMNPGSGSTELRWGDLGPVAGQGTHYDVVAGRVRDLHQGLSFSGAQCAVSGAASIIISDPVPDPAPGEAVYYLVRGRNSCGPGTYGEPDALSGPRAQLDASSPCPNL